MSRPLKRLTVGALTDYGLKPYEMIEGETRQVFTEWMPYAGLRDTAVSSSAWSKETTAITLAGAALSGDRSSVLVTAVEPGVYPIQCTATLANGEKITKTWRIDIRPLEESADDVAGVTCPTLLEPPDGEIDVDGSSVEFVVGAPATATVAFFLWIDGETMPVAPTDAMTYNGTNWIHTETGLLSDTLYNWYASATLNGLTSSGCDVGQFSFTTEAFVCGMPDAGSYLISPAWELTYPQGYTASAPYSDGATGEYTLGDNKAVDAQGDPEPAPGALVVTLTQTLWTHAGAFVGNASPTVTVPKPPADAIWGGAVLRRLSTELVPVQFSNGLMIASRGGYSNIGGSAWQSSGWVTVGGVYGGDIDGYTPGDSSLPDTRGDSIPVSFAKFYNGATYVVEGVTASGPQKTLHRFAAGPGLPAPIGETFSGEDLYPGPTATRVHADFVMDMTYDPTTSSLYLLLFVSIDFGVLTVAIEKISPTALTTTERWERQDASFEAGISGFTVRGTRAVLASAAGGSSARRFYIVELNGSGGMDIIHLGLDEVDPSASLPGALVWADPVCGWLKQKRRWISPVIGV